MEDKMRKFFLKRLFATHRVALEQKVGAFELADEDALEAFMKIHKDNLAEIVELVESRDKAEHKADSFVLTGFQKGGELTRCVKCGLAGRLTRIFFAARFKPCVSFPRAPPSYWTAFTSTTALRCTRVGLTRLARALTNASSVTDSVYCHSKKQNKWLLGKVTKVWDAERYDVTLDATQEVEVQVTRERLKLVGGPAKMSAPQLDVKAEVKVGEARVWGKRE